MLIMLKLTVNIQVVHSEENPELVIMYPTLIRY